RPTGPYSLHSLQRHAHPRDLPSFPTRRSSDLGARLLTPARAARRRRARQPERRRDRARPSARHVGRAPCADRAARAGEARRQARDRKSTRLNSSHSQISYAVFCLKKKKNLTRDARHSIRVIKTTIKRLNIRKPFISETRTKVAARFLTPVQATLIPLMESKIAKFS